MEPMELEKLAAAESLGIDYRITEGEKGAIVVFVVGSETLEIIKQQDRQPDYIGGF